MLEGPRAQGRVHRAGAASRGRPADREAVEPSRAPQSSVCAEGSREHQPQPPDPSRVSTHPGQHTPVSQTSRWGRTEGPKPREDLQPDVMSVLLLSDSTLSTQVQQRSRWCSGGSSPPRLNDCERTRTGAGSEAEWGACAKPSAPLPQLIGQKGPRPI